MNLTPNSYARAELSGNSRFSNFLELCNEKFNERVKTRTLVGSLLAGDVIVRTLREVLLESLLSDSLSVSL